MKNLKIILIAAAIAVATSSQASAFMRERSGGPDWAYAIVAFWYSTHWQFRAAGNAVDRMNTQYDCRTIQTTNGVVNIC